MMVKYHILFLIVCSFFSGAMASHLSDKTAGGILVLFVANLGSIPATHVVA